jgi:hypothetical protein
MAINPLPTPPAPTDSPQDFNTKAFSLLGALPDFVTEANAQAVQVDTDAGTASNAASTATGAASTATTKASEASDSADAAALSATEAAGLVENYQGALGSDPTLNKDGDPLVAGDWYVNTATGLIRAYDGTQWVTSLNVTAGVESFSAGSTGLTPSTGTTGDVVLAGTLVAVNGGTGLTSPGTAGNVLTSDGTGWTSTAPSSLKVGALQYFAGATTTTYPGEEWLLADGSIVTQTAYSELFDRVGLIGDEFGATWATVSSGTSVTLFGIAYDGNVFVYAGSGDVATSTNGITWTARTSGTASTILSLTYGDGLFVYGTTGGGLSTSTDGITWTARTSGTANNIWALIYAAGIFVYAGSGGVLATSTDAITWTARTSGTATDIFALLYADNTYVYAGSGGVLATSTNAITWTARTSGTASVIWKLTYGENIFVYSGDGGVLATSTNAITWTARTSGLTTQIRALLYANEIFVFGDQDGVIRTSTNAITWTTRTSGTTSQMLNFGFGDDKLLYVGAGGIVGYSSEYDYDPNTEFKLPEATVTNIINIENNLFIKAE